jgi:hypothetical protein
MGRKTKWKEKKREGRRKGEMKPSLNEDGIPKTLRCGILFLLGKL